MRRVHLLEREHPLAVLQERGQQAFDGHGRLVLVAGEAGLPACEIDFLDAMVRAASE